MTTVSCVVAACLLLLASGSLVRCSTIPSTDEATSSSGFSFTSSAGFSTTEAPAAASAAVSPVKPSVAAASGKPVQLYNAATDQYVFVSRDKLGSPPDDIIKTHKLDSPAEARTLFVLQSVGNDRYRIFNSATGQRLFVSNDRVASDRVVEARKDIDEARTEFEFVSAGNNQYYIYSPSFGEYLFVSSNIIEGEKVLQSRANRGEEHSKFTLLQSL